MVNFEIVDRCCIYYESELTEQIDKEQQDQGRHTLHNAAERLALEAGEAKPEYTEMDNGDGQKLYKRISAGLVETEFVSKLLIAIKAGELTAYLPGAIDSVNVALRNEKGFKKLNGLIDKHSLPMECFVQVKWDALNDWLKINEPLLFSKFQFPDPNPPAAEEQDTQGAMDATLPAKSQIVDNDKPIDTANLAYWRMILNSNIGKIDTIKKANVRAIIKYLRELGDKRLPNKGGHDELLWLDDEGTEHIVEKKTVSNAISDARKLL